MPTDTDLQFCQSCGMPLADDATKGSEADGSLSQKYCSYCYADGAFTADLTMMEMIELNLTYLDEWNADQSEPVDKEKARAELAAYLPSLERWRS